MNKFKYRCVYTVNSICLFVYLSVCVKSGKRKINCKTGATCTKLALNQYKTWHKKLQNRRQSVQNLTKIVQNWRQIITRKTGAHMYISNSNIATARAKM